MNKDIVIKISGDTMRFIYNDDLNELNSEGTVAIQRASYVEPNEDGKWVADMSPVGGPKLGPFDLRQDALDSEVEWLLAHNIPVPLKENQE